MVHPLNELKDVRKARAEVNKVKRAAGSVVTPAELEAVKEELRAEFASSLVDLSEAVDAQLAPVRAALEIDDLDHAIDELDGLPADGDVQEEPEP